MQKPKHRPDGSVRTADNCVCGARILYFENDTQGIYGYGCEALGRPTQAFAIEGKNA